MTKYREILRLKSLGFSERNIAQSCGVSRNTVAKVLKKAAEINLSWSLDFDMTDSALEELMFPKDKSATNRRMPNFDYIRKELLRNGVNKKLLWVEYCEECRMSSEEPLMYSQFCYYIQKNEEKRRATMHIPRKPGEQIEVDSSSMIMIELEALNWSFPVAATYLHIYLLRYFHAACIPMQKPFLT